MGRTLAFLSMELEDITRPPIYDALLVVSMILGGLYASIIPRISAVKLAIDVTNIPLFIAIIYLAIRGSAGLASLVSNTVLQLYLTYPLSRRIILTVLLITRILLPSILIVGSPLLTASIIMFSTVSEELLEVLIIFAGRIMYLYFIGIIFMLIALGTKRTTLAGILSIVFYFAYIFIAGIMTTLSFVLELQVFKYIALSLMFSDTLNNYVIGLNVPYWTLIPVPLASIILTVLLYIYFTRRFEPT